MNHITMTGNACDEPELAYDTAGVGRAKFRVAVVHRRDDDPQFFSVICWRGLAENVAASIRRGDRVTVNGWVNSGQSYVDDEGRRRYSTEVVATDVSLSLLWATGSVLRIDRVPPPFELPAA